MSRGMWGGVFAMSDRENKAGVEKLQEASSSAEPQRMELERLTRLPLAALLYYVLYGDERLARLT